MRLIPIILILFHSAYAQIDTSLFGNWSARSIGPAGMSGRVAAIDAVPSDPAVIYVGAATGGVWKSTNGGISWRPIFDDQPASSIGAIAIQHSNPNVVWVGTGESNVRNSAGVGRGVYKSIDAGATWKFVGLEKTHLISKIIIHPMNPDIVYVAALGTMWGENPDRGVFRTTDGGKTWKKILYVNERTGAADLAIDPFNPAHLMVSMWEFRRWPWHFKSGGTSSGLYVTQDDGDSWKQLTSREGLPEGELGKIGLAFAPGRQGVAYALVEAKSSALLRSEDGGRSWKTVNKDRDVNQRPFYFGQIAVHPKNENLLYRLAFTLDASEDGGKTFASTSPWTIVHPDYHALWIHPDGEEIISGNDGGIAISHDRGRTWKFVMNLPLGQFYHISYDMQTPYYVYGGMQDNGSWRGPSNTFKSNGIDNHEWELVYFGDGFDTEPDPENSDYGYAMAQGGYLAYYNYQTAVRKDIRPTESSVRHRYNWNAGFAIDPFDSKTIYYGSQFVHKSTDKGVTWEIISPDLTTNDSTKLKQSESGGLTADVTGAENHCTILSIAPSPVRKDVLWVGTDDGNLQLTTDGGRTWTRVSDAIYRIKAKGLAPPAATWIPNVEPSRFDAGTAYVVFDDHRRANWQSYVFVTRDFGKTWQSLVTPDVDGFCHILRQDPVNPDLLYLGTEFGLFISLNGGKQWMKWTRGVPTVPVYDLAIHPRDHDLIIGTHGRAAHILDDVTPLRRAADAVGKDFHLFDISPAYQYNTAYWAGPFTSSGAGMFKGKQREYGALITFYANPPDSIVAREGTPKAERIKLDVLEGDSLIRQIRVPLRRGLNRVSWDLQRGAFHSPTSVDSTDIEQGGLFVLPGKYTLRVTYRGTEFRRTVEVKPDPRIPTVLDALRENYEMATKAGSLMEVLSKAYKQIKDTRKSIAWVLGRLDGMDTTVAAPLKRHAQQLETKLTRLSDRIQIEGAAGIPDDELQLIYHVQSALYGVTSHFDVPTQANRVKLEKTKRDIEEFLKEYNQTYETDVQSFRDATSKIGFFKNAERLDIRD